MRLRVWLVVCLFLAFLGTGCRKGLGPSFDNNLPPETWITAAPAETITVKDNLGRPIPPVLGRIPVRYHLYWAGSDRDGAVAGYFWAVTETLAVSPGLGAPIPELPGPKARDYHFTRRSDSIFVFEVSPDSPEREHAIYIYAVDDKGKADPTPAKLTFRAYDRFPPQPVFTLAQAKGTIYVANGSVVTPIPDQTFDMTHEFTPGNPVPVDIVPSGSQLTFKWHAVSPLPTVVCVGYRFRLDEPNFNVVGANDTVAVYNTHVGGDVIAPGVKKFTLQALDQAGGHGDVTRYFQMNFEPDEWYSGPDTTNLAFWNLTVDGNGKRYYSHQMTSEPPVAGLTWAAWAAAGGLPGTMLSPDSALILPSARPNRKTFFEIYNHSIYAHAEFDTVNLNSIVIFPMGGLDKDSPYIMKIGTSPGTPFPIGPVTTSGGPNGSPIGFKSLVLTRKPDGTFQIPTESTVFPVYDVTSPYYVPQMNPMADAQVSGQAYAYAVAQDGDGLVDRRIVRASASGSPAIVDLVDSNSPAATQAMRDIRPHILVFFVNHAPFLQTTLNGAVNTNFIPNPSGSTQLHAGQFTSFVLPAIDADPIDYAGQFATPGGPQPSTSPVLVYTVTIQGKNSSNVDTTWVIANALQLSGSLPFTVPPDIQIGNATVSIQVCDYRTTDAALGNKGRCSPTTTIPIQIIGPAPARATQSSEASTTQRPGSLPTEGRRQLP